MAVFVTLCFLVLWIFFILAIFIGLIIFMIWATKKRKEQFDDYVDTKAKAKLYDDMKDKK